ncbi:MAG: porin family protein, partial [Proteobacteria bacterium]|nr:porin family protein [Pseudomonadota bacterium]
SPAETSPLSAEEQARQAEEAAREAAAAAEAAAAKAAEARARADEERLDAEAAAAAEEAAEKEVEDAAADARRAAEDARSAAEAARNAADYARRQNERKGLARRGPYLGLGGFYAPEDLENDKDFVVKSSRGLFAEAGYRVHPNIAVGVRGDWLEGFDFASDVVEDGEIDGWAGTLTGKFYLLRGSIQPYATLGLGVIVADIESENRVTGERRDDDETAEFLRGGLGIALALSEYAWLTAEGAYATAGDDLDGLDFGVLSVGLEYRF